MWKEFNNFLTDVYSILDHYPEIHKIAVYIVVAAVVICCYMLVFVSDKARVAVVNHQLNKDIIRELESLCRERMKVARRVVAEANDLFPGRRREEKLSLYYMILQHNRMLKARINEMKGGLDGSKNNNGENHRIRYDVRGSLGFNGEKVDIRRVV